MDALDFAWAHIGDVVSSEGGLGGECVDLANLWLQENFRLPHVYANAVDWRTQLIRGFKWEANLPHNAPTQGSLVVWGPNPFWGIGPNGHIALCLTASTRYLSTLDQNWPEHAETRQHLHDYRGVLGWQRPGG